MSIEFEKIFLKKLYMLICDDTFINLELLI